MAETERNICREIAAELGVELRPRSEWSDEQKIQLDLLVYGIGFARLRADGSHEHIPAAEVLVFTRGG